MVPGGKCVRWRWLEIYGNLIGILQWFWGVVIRSVSFGQDEGLGLHTFNAQGTWPVFSQAHYGLLLPLLLVQGQVGPWFNLAACNFHEDIKRQPVHRSWWNCVVGFLALVPQIFVKARDWSLSAFFAAFRIDPRGEWVTGFLSHKTQRTIRRVSSLQ